MSHIVQLMRPVELVSREVMALPHEANLIWVSQQSYYLKLVSKVLHSTLSFYMSNSNLSEILAFLAPSCAY